MALCRCTAFVDDGGMTTCNGCGYVFESISGSEALGEIRRLARQLRERLGTAMTVPGGLEALRTRREPQVWSALEYAGHIRDVLIVQRERLFIVLMNDEPTFSPMYPNERVVLVHYNDEDPATTGTEAVIAADLFVRSFAFLSDEQLARRFPYSYPEAAERDLTWLTQHVAHECRHHLGDVDEVLAAVGFVAPG
jgi:hypothetical protein